jgi:hypothetical protein
VLLGLAVGSIAGWAVVISSVSFIWVAPAASAATIAAAYLLGRPPANQQSPRRKFGPSAEQTVVKRLD